MDNCLGFLLLIVFGVLFGIFLGQLYNRPTALEVYQGKTTLEITYKDGVAMDSTVVYKNK